MSDKLLTKKLNKLNTLKEKLVSRGCDNKKDVVEEIKDTIEDIELVIEEEDSKSK